MSEVVPEPTFEEAALALQRRFEHGIEAALARMILHCASREVPLPKWAADAYIEGFMRVAKGEISSWDDVLGRAHPKGRHLKAFMKEAMAHEVYRRVRDIHEGPKEKDKNGRLRRVPIDGDLFERVGRDLGIGGKSTAARLYAQVRDAIE